MLLVEDSIRERVARITIEHRDSPLQNDRPAVELERHDMNGHAAYLDPMLNCLVLCVHPGKCRQQRRDKAEPLMEELAARGGRDARVIGVIEPGEPPSVSYVNLS